MQHAIKTEHLGLPHAYHDASHQCRPNCAALSAFRIHDGKGWGVGVVGRGTKGCLTNCEIYGNAYW